MYVCIIHLPKYWTRCLFIWTYVDIYFKTAFQPTCNQQVNAIGTILLGKDKPKPVQIKSTQKMSAVKEDCVLEDDKGTAILHIWDPLIKK